MKKFYSFLGALLVATGLFAQTNYTCTFLANVPMDSVQVKNTVSGEAKMLYYPDNEITLQKVDNQNVAVATVGNSAFLQQTANNIVAVNVETTSQLNLTLYSANGTVVARYANAVSAGQYTFQVGASAGVYVLVASANAQTASLKLSLLENAQAGIFEVATAEPVAFLKSADDVITFNEGEEFEFTGYYKKQTDIKTSAIIKDEEIIFAFEREYEGAIKFAFSVSDDKQVYFSQGNLQYQASTGIWRFAENQFDYIGAGDGVDGGTRLYGNVYFGEKMCSNKRISSTYDGLIDLFGWGTSGWSGSGAKEYQPYSISTTDSDYGPSGAVNLTDAYANADWGVYNAISNGGNRAGLWRTLTDREWQYLISYRTDAANKVAAATVNGVQGTIYLPDNWTLPNGMSFTSGFERTYEVNVYTKSDWTVMEQNGAVFLPITMERNEDYLYLNSSNMGYYWTSSTLYAASAFYVSCFIQFSPKIETNRRHSGFAVRLVADVE